MCLYKSRRKFGLDFITRRVTRKIGAENKATSRTGGARNKIKRSLPQRYLISNDDFTGRKLCVIKSSDDDDDDYVYFLSHVGPTLLQERGPRANNEIRL